MRFFLFLFLLALLFACKSETGPTENSSAHSSGEQSVSSINDFSDLEQKDESCATEEDLEKKLVEQAKKPESIQLQGGDAGCSTD